MLQYHLLLVYKFLFLLNACRMAKYSTNLAAGRPVGSTSFQSKPAKAFGKVLREQRVKQGLSQEELGHIAGVPRNHIGNIERGENLPTLGLVFKLSVALKIPAATLIAETERIMK